MVSPISSTVPHHPRPARSRHPYLRNALLGAGLSAMSAVNGCGGDGLAPGKVVPPSELYWTLELNHRAVTLATGATPPYDTLTLVATPRAVDGTPLAGLPAATYVSMDPEKVAVTADGVLYGVEPTSDPRGVLVVVTATAGNLKHTDSAWVKVVTLDGPPPILASFSIHPTPAVEGYADSAKAGPLGPVNETDMRTSTCFALPAWSVPAQCTVLLPVRVLDATGAPIPDVPVAIRTSDREAAVLDHGNIVLGARLPPSEVMFYGSTTIFGITKADTLPFRIGWPVYVPMRVTQTGFEYPVFKVGTGAMVVWENQAPFAVDVNFADPTNVAKVAPAPSFLPPFFASFVCQSLALCDDAGNMVLSPSSGGFGAMRRFPVPGTYDYSSTALGTGGRIIVVDER